MSDELIGNPCPICGQPIPERRRGSRRGHPPKTCGEVCRKERHRRLEAERYLRVKDTPEWRATRQAYNDKLKQKLVHDPDFAALFRAEAYARTREWRVRLRAEDPARYEQMKADSRTERKAWREALVSDPAAWEAHKAKCREWYRSLSDEDRARIYKRKSGNE